MMSEIFTIAVTGAAGVGLATGIRWWWKGRKTITACPRCQKRAVWKTMEGTDELSRCANCDWQRYKHGKPVHDNKPKECPSCSGHIIFSMESIARGGVWTCVGYPDRDSIVKVRGEKMTPKSLQSIKPCGWKGLDDDYGKVWR